MENGFDPLIYKRYLKKKETFLLFKKIGQMSAFKNLKLQLKRREVINRYVENDKIKEALYKSFLKKSS